MKFTITSRTGQQHEYELSKLLKRRPVGEFEVIDAGNNTYRVYGKSGSLTSHLGNVSKKGDNVHINWLSGSQYQMIAKAFKYFVDTGKQILIPYIPVLIKKKVFMFQHINQLLQDKNQHQ